MKSDQANQSWQKIVAKYQEPSAFQSWWQVINSLGPFLLLWFLMVLSLKTSYWLTLLLAIPAAGFMIRIFIIFHDCGHSSFFESKKLNDTLGIITGIMTFTPYYAWRHNHAVHHATVGDLDRRGTGDVWTLTLQEYQNLPRWKKFTYRLYRNPLIMFTIGPMFVFIFGHRFPSKKGGKRERDSVIWTDVALLALILLISAVIGFKSFLLIQLPIMFLGTSVGVWLFYVQHQFEGVYWERHERWDFLSASLEGSSYYKLPRVLQWFTGNIGFHHVHHISPRIPNYYLEECHNGHELFKQVKPLSLLGSAKSLFLHLYDEERKALVTFREAAH